MAELVDALDSKSSSARSAGSIPALGTKGLKMRFLYLNFNPFLCLLVCVFDEVSDNGDNF